MAKLTWRIWLLIFSLALSLIFIFGLPPLFLETGVIVKSVDLNSSAFESGISQGEIITEINQQKINNLEDYSNFITPLFENPSQPTKLVIKTKHNTYVFFTDKIPPIILGDIPKTNLRTGLDLSGGSRALIKPEVKLDENEIDKLKDLTKTRLDVYGLQDVQVKKVSDLSGNNFILIEIAGASPNDLEKLVGEQGKFEAKIGNQTVFTGGDQDIGHVCRNDATCSRIESCQDTTDGAYCSYSFEIHISEEAAKRHADITRDLELNETNSDYLEKPIDFYVDDKLSTSLLISKGLRGLETTQIQISGSSIGIDQQTAFENAQDEMKRMQTILITGSLPYKLEIAKLDTISPTLGNEFNKLIFYLSISALAIVSLIIFIRYRKLKATLALLFTAFSEIVIILGIASAINWSLDIPAIIGILVTIGTGVDQQIIILDESYSKRSESLKQKIKAAFFIVVSAYLTTVVALIPLWRAGAGLLKGFAITTLIGLTMGVLITRPAFADMLKLLNKNAT
ncbi:MAG: MMPL family transporter [Nanoarchaeota archaeon]|nr:MMPL family transporter [Nanoarchaeota archaeon]